MTITDLLELGALRCNQSEKQRLALCVHTMKKLVAPSYLSFDLGALCVANSTQIQIGILLPQALLHPEAHEEGGFGFTNKELLAKQRGVVTDIIKEVSPLQQSYDLAGI